MEYSMKNTKEELIKMLDEQKHLAQAVDAKDSEIVKLKKEFDEFKRKSETKRAEDIKAIKDSEEKVKLSLQHKVEDLSQRLESYGDVEQLKKGYDILLQENKKLVSSLNSYIQAFRNHMKAVQATLDNTIELEALLFEKLQQKQEVNK